MSQIPDTSGSAPAGPPDFLTLVEGGDGGGDGTEHGVSNAHAFEHSGGLTGIPVGSAWQAVPDTALPARGAARWPMTWPTTIASATEPEIVPQSRPTKRLKRTVESRSTAQLSLAVESLEST